MSNDETLDMTAEAIARQLSSKAITCPHCQGEVHISPVAKLVAESGISFRIAPKPGSFLSAATVGGVLIQIGKLNAALARDMGFRCATLVKHVSCDETGEITFDLLLLNVAGPKRKPKAKPT